MKSTARTVATAASLALVGSLFGVLAAPGATAAPVQPTDLSTQHWFGQYEIVDEEFDEFMTSSVLLIKTKPGSPKPLPFHSYSTAELFDCAGNKVLDDYGFSFNERRDKGAWRTDIGVDLAVPAGGTYSHWVVTLHSKGREPVPVTITRTKWLTLGCDGEFKRDSRMQYSPKNRTPRPVNADFTRSAAALLKPHASFGRVVGQPRIGSTVRIKGAAAYVNGKRRQRLCATAIEVSYPTKKSWSSGIGGSCNQAYYVGPRVLFHTAKGNQRNVSAVGKKVFLQTSVSIKGHNYWRTFSLGRIKR